MIPLRVEENIVSKQYVLEDEVEGVVFFTAVSQNHSFPANGGLRIFPYPSKAAARKSCQDLADIMETKHALYGTHFSGAKIVAWADPASIDKEKLLQAVGASLNRLQGQVYTGCDVNTTKMDMERLVQFTPYVLSGLRSTVDGSMATAHGVLGSIRAVFRDDLVGRSILVVGSGKVGATLAMLLHAKGCHVDCLDAVVSKANIPGCRNVSTLASVWEQSYELVAVCSPKDVISPEVAETIQAPFVLGSTNELFANPAINHVLARHGVLCLPSVVSSAGAVICDSVEMYNEILFHRTPETLLYQFVEEQTLKKTAEIVGTLSHLRSIPPAHALLQELSAFYPSNAYCCGEFFTEWLRQQHGIDLRKTEE